MNSLWGNGKKKFKNFIFFIEKLIEGLEVYLRIFIGELNPGETWDDGNIDDNDGWSSTWIEEVGWFCGVILPSNWTLPYWGNGKDFHWKSFWFRLT